MDNRQSINGQAQAVAGRSVTKGGYLVSEVEDNGLERETGQLRDRCYFYIDPFLPSFRVRVRPTIVPMGPFSFSPDSRLIYFFGWPQNADHRHHQTAQRAKLDKSGRVALRGRASRLRPHPQPGDQIPPSDGVLCPIAYTLRN